MTEDEPAVVFTVKAHIDKDRDGSGQWHARGVEAMAGVFALGASFHDARKNFAANAVLAVGPIAETQSQPAPEMIRVWALTRKTFRADELTDGSE